MYLLTFSKSKSTPKPGFSVGSNILSFSIILSFRIVSSKSVAGEGHLTAFKLQAKCIAAIAIKS